MVTILLRAVIMTWFCSLSLVAMTQEWQGKWISSALSEEDTVNVWIAFKKDIKLNHKPKKAIARIAVDSKYWLYVNGEMVVFEGGLKRGPNPNDTYYDEVDLSSVLKKGKNDISILMWYFGKDGFSHNSSHNPALYIDLQIDGQLITSDKTWSVKLLEEFKTAPGPIPNFRLAESNILYDARVASDDWEKKDIDDTFTSAIEKGNVGDLPWGLLVKRPIPLWKDFGVKQFDAKDIERRGDTLICKLPYNMQFTPLFDIEADAGEIIKVMTDNYLFYNGSAENIRAEYITKKGKQSYENLGWLNGHYVYFIIPKTIKVNNLAYRETGYDTEFAGYFESSDPFFNKLWEKARRTLYITMRDTYMDCPDRERAQWTGDAVLEAEEAFYALDPKSHALAYKWLYELINWQKPDGVLFSPIPAGNWDKELPDQILASVGYYGIWTYYMHTGDKKMLKDLYGPVQKYMGLWDKDDDNLVKLREGGWQWGDWGENKDMLLLYNLWYYLSLKGSWLMANELNYSEDKIKIAKEMENFKIVFNERYWKNNQYRDPKYTGKTDDRVHALAILADIADQDKYTAIAKVFGEQEHASPYMEKYVYEAMYKMGLPVEANNRHKKRFSPMVNNDYFTTLFEGWGIGGDGFGGGTVNHAWSGGGLTILSSKLCGISPLSPGYSTFLVKPQLGDVEFAKARVPTIKGNIDIDLKKNSRQKEIKLVVPTTTEAVVDLPLSSYRTLIIGEDKLIQNGVKDLSLFNKYNFNPSTQRFSLTPGQWLIIAKF